MVCKIKFLFNKFFLSWIFTITKFLSTSILTPSKIVSYFVTFFLSCINSNPLDTSNPWLIKKFILRYQEVWEILDFLIISEMIKCISMTDPMIEFLSWSAKDSKKILDNFGSLIWTHLDGDCFDFSTWTIFCNNICSNPSSSCSKKFLEHHLVYENFGLPGQDPYHVSPLVFVQFCLTFLYSGCPQ